MPQQQAKCVTFYVCRKSRMRLERLKLRAKQKHSFVTATLPAVVQRLFADPVSRLVAAGVLMQTGRANPAVIALAVDSASDQGWRRPLLAWLGVQLQRAEQAGDSDAAERLRRRIGRIQSP